MEMDSPLVAKKADSVLRVLLPRRPSSSAYEIQPDDNGAEHRDAWLLEFSDDASAINCIAEGATAQVCDTVQSLIANGGIALVLVKELCDISRLSEDCWRIAAACVNSNCRLIAIEDAIDTASQNWEIAMHVACMRHCM